jgi:hypothetical protein
MGTGTPKYEIPEQQVKPLPQGASNQQQAAVVRMQTNNQAQNATNQALAGGKKKRVGGSSQITIAPARVSYNETSAGSSSINSQLKSNVTSDVQNQEYKSMDAGAFKKGGKRRNKSRKSGKRKSKRRRTRKYRK